MASGSLTFMPFLLCGARGKANISLALPLDISRKGSDWLSFYHLATLEPMIVSEI